MIGLDHLGLAHDLYPVRKVIELTPYGSAIGCFDSDNAFGPALPKLRRVLDSGKFPVVRIHAHWGGKAHKIIPMELLKKKLPSYEKLALDYPSVLVYVSHSCEYIEGELERIKERANLIKVEAPHCIPVNSVLRGPTMPSVITERHGDVNVKPGEIVSFDGCNCYDCDIEEWKIKNRNASICFLWGYRFNLRQLTKPGEAPPPPSERKAVPSSKYIKSVVTLCEEIGEPPVPIFPDDIIPIKKPLLWKSHSEDSQGPPNLRANKPIFICPAKVSSLDIVTWDNKTIGKLMYGGEFDGNLHRYYSGLPGGLNMYGYEIANRASKKSGSKSIWLKAKHKYYGPVINPAYRQGFFR